MLEAAGVADGVSTSFGTVFVAVAASAPGGMRGSAYMAGPSGSMAERQSAQRSACEKAAPLRSSRIPIEKHHECSDSRSTNISITLRTKRVVARLVSTSSMTGEAPSNLGISRMLMKTLSPSSPNTSLTSHSLRRRRVERCNATANKDLPLKHIVRCRVVAMLAIARPSPRPSRMGTISVSFTSSFPDILAYAVAMIATNR
mmetsp:Transcript_68997/g.122853  ORF Transcript_68997/g.122853 Transcript_68997/m.122853 type:complete len:201 (-) Transcript_68997:1756-2358(-)